MSNSKQPNGVPPSSPVPFQAMGSGSGHPPPPPLGPPPELVKITFHILPAGAIKTARVWINDVEWKSDYRFQQHIPSRVVVTADGYQKYTQTLTASQDASFTIQLIKAK